MANKKISNQETKVSKTINLNDRDYINDMLLTEKNLGVSMTIALHEISNEKLFLKVKEISNDINNSQRKLFDLAFSKGWYSLEEVDKTKIKEEKQKLKTLLDELNHKI